MAGKYIVQKNNKGGWAVGFYNNTGWWPVEDRTNYLEANERARLWNQNAESMRKARNGDSPD